MYCTQMSTFTVYAVANVYVVQSLECLVIATSHSNHVLVLVIEIEFEEG